MRELTVDELVEVNGGEILISPGQLGIALTDNSLVVITGMAEAGALLSVASAGFAAGSIGYSIGSWLDSQFNISSRLAEACWNYAH